MLVQNGHSFVVSGSWFKPGNAVLLWDDTISLGNAVIDGTGFFNATVQVPNTSAGRHKLTINDGNVVFCVNLTCLPLVSNDYVNGWHSHDITVSLTPDYPVNETFYRINGGNVCNLTNNGSPIITVESFNNTLEYWSTWEVYGTTLNELPHITISGIQLDKTAPTGSLTMGTPSSQTTSVTLALSATDNTSGVSQMRFSNNNSIWSEWEPFQTTKPWTLSDGEGLKIVWVQFNNNAGLTSTYNYTLTLEIPLPTATPTPSLEPPTPTITPSTNPTNNPMATSAVIVIETQNPTTTESPDPSPTSTPHQSPIITTSPNLTSTPDLTNNILPSNPQTTPSIPEIPLCILTIFVLVSLLIAPVIKKKTKISHK